MAGQAGREELGGVESVFVDVYVKSLATMLMSETLCSVVLVVVHNELVAVLIQCSSLRSKGKNASG